MNEKKSVSVHEVIDGYERRILSLTGGVCDRKPWKEEERLEIIKIAKRCLGVRDEWIPDINVESVASRDTSDFSCECLKFTSWPGVVGAANLYTPSLKKSARLPLVVLCCGHGAQGKLTPGYQLMARQICRQGAMVLVPDNIGQGERVAMGHHGAFGPFAQGGSVQGLIVMETLAWIRWAQSNTLVDSNRIAAIGNSGGGVLTLFLAAFCPELAAISSSGYPSTFEFIARKEKIHCACNILPRIIGQLEMWQLYGCFAPKPLLLFQGVNDNLFPIDVFLSTVRKVGRVYKEKGALDNFNYRQIEGWHSWIAESREVVAEFLAKHLKLTHSISNESEKLFSESDLSIGEWPKDALITDEIIPSLTGEKSGRSIALSDIYPTDISYVFEESPRIPESQIKRYFAQLECFMKVD